VEVLPNNPNLPGLPAANAERWRRPNLHARNDDFFGDYVFDDEMDEEDLAQVTQAITHLEDYDIQPAIRPGPAAVNASAATLPPRRPSNSDPDFPSETKDECINKVLEVFGDICRDHVSGLYDSVSKSSERILACIVDKIEKGQGFPKAKVLKRKRQLTEYEEAAQKYATADRIVSPDWAQTRQLT
jgi:TRIAD3 protein (E3 ubiquitin-protein ligase RNF216)